MLSIIVVIGKNRELGKDNHLIWNIPGDLKRFRKITTGHPVIMGRKTFESIGHPLPNRKNIVISGHKIIPGVITVRTIEEAIEKAQGDTEVFVIGGASVYSQSIDRADRLYLTVVDAVAPDADSFFPDYSKFSKVLEKSFQEENGLHFTYLILEK